MNDTSGRLAELAGAIVITLILAYVDIWDLGITWYAIVVFVLAAPPLGVALIALLKKIPAVPDLAVVPSSDPSIPHEARVAMDAKLHRLKSIGLEPVGPLIRIMDESFQIVLQHPKTTDLVIVLVGDVGMVECARLRSDGSWLETSAAPGAINWESHPRDDALYVGGGTDPVLLWKAHQIRVARDPLAVQNPRISDPVAFLRDLGRRGTEYEIAAGLRTRTSDNQTRATLKGALQLGIRMASPWTLLHYWHGHRTMRALLAGADQAAHETADPSHRETRSGGGSP
jgi:hypothetical protein